MKISVHQERFYRLLKDYLIPCPECGKKIDLELMVYVEVKSCPHCRKRLKALEHRNYK